MSDEQIFCYWLVEKEATRTLKKIKAKPLSSRIVKERIRNIVFTDPRPIYEFFTSFEVPSIPCQWEQLYPRISQRSGSSYAYPTNSFPKIENTTSQEITPRSLRSVVSGADVESTLPHFHSPNSDLFTTYSPEHSSIECSSSYSTNTGFVVAVNIVDRRMWAF